MELLEKGPIEIGEFEKQVQINFDDDLIQPIQNIESGDVVSLWFKAADNFFTVFSKTDGFFLFESPDVKLFESVNNC